MCKFPKYEYETCITKVDSIPLGSVVEIECIHTGKFVIGKYFQIVGLSYSITELEYITVALYDGTIGKLLKKEC